VNRVLLVTGVLSATLLATLTSCSSDSRDVAAPAKPTNSSVTTAPADSSVPAGWKKVSNPAAGLSIAVPKGWIDIDISSGEIADSLREARISGPSAAAIEKGASALAGRKLLYVVDAAGASGDYVNNISGLCGPNGGVPADQLENTTKTGLARLGAQDLQSSKLTIGGMPAVKVSYRMQAQVKALAVQFRVLVPGDKVCGLTFGMKPGMEIKDLDQIAGTLRPL
jgi:hypothetical protein